MKDKNGNKKGRKMLEEYKKNSQQIVCSRHDLALAFANLIKEFSLKCVEESMLSPTHLEEVIEASLDSFTSSVHKPIDPFTSFSWKISHSDCSEKEYEEKIWKRTASVFDYLDILLEDDPEGMELEILSLCFIICATENVEEEDQDRYMGNLITTMKSEFDHRNAEKRGHSI